MTNLDKEQTPNGDPGEETRPPVQPVEEAYENTEPIEVAPNLDQIESSKTALMTFCMYHYQALREAGYSVDQAKEKVADEIIALYDKYAQNARITYRPDTMRNPKTLLNEITSDVKDLGLPGKAIHQKLLDFKRLIQE